MTITRINPETLHVSPFFSQGMLVEGGRTLYIGGQNGTDANGEIQGDIVQQTEQACRNVLAVVEAAGGTIADVVKLTFILTEGADLYAGYTAGARVLEGFNGAISVLRVAGLARPEALVEIEGIAHPGA